MKNKIAMLKWTIAWLVFGFRLTALAQSNFWTNTASAHWDDSFWSLGIPPGSGQSVVITNDFWKAIGIFPSTPADHPETMTIRNLTLGGSIPGSLNMVLLNYSGTDTPLHITNRCELNRDGIIQNLYSGLQVDGPL